MRAYALNPRRIPSVISVGTFANLGQVNFKLCKPCSQLQDTHMQNSESPKPYIKLESPKTLQP